jgi:dephospho-CoA kinase
VSAVAAWSIGLTGGIGSGKSSVAQLLVALGAHRVDTDAISRRLTAAGGAALPPIAAEFGAALIGQDGALDRARMRELVFADPTARQRLEAILHPMIGTQTQREASEAQPGQSVVFDVPLLTESGRWRREVDQVLVVDCDEDTQVQRVVARNRWPPEQVRAVMANQATRAQRRAIADAVIVNGGGTTWPELEAQVRALWRDWHAPDDGSAASLWNNPGTPR